MPKKKIVRKAAKPVKARTKKAVKSVKARRKKAAPRGAAKRSGKSLKRKGSRAGELSLEKIGEVTHYFPHVNAAAVKLLKSGISIGDSIYIKGHTTDFREKVRSIQLDHSAIEEGKKGQEIGLYVKSRVRIGDSVYKV